MIILIGSLSFSVVYAWTFADPSTYIQLHNGDFNILLRAAYIHTHTQTNSTSAICMPVSTASGATRGAAWTYSSDPISISCTMEQAPWFMNSAKKDHIRKARTYCIYKTRTHARSHTHTHIRMHLGHTPRNSRKHTQGAHISTYILRRLYLYSMHALCTWITNHTHSTIYIMYSISLTQAQLSVHANVFCELLRARLDFT